MKRTKKVFSIKDVPYIKEQILHWVNQFSFCSFLDNHQYASAHHSLECIAAAGEIGIIKGANTAEEIDLFYQSNRDWLFGHFAYEYNAKHIDGSQQKNPINFSEAFFFRPDHILTLNEEGLIIETHSLDPDQIFTQIIATNIAVKNSGPILIRAGMSKENYIATIQQLQAHIQQGDCYEINFCQEFHSENAAANPVSLYKQLTQLSPTPFACYYKENDAHLICASPERWLKKLGDKIISQPIKGTVKREPFNTTKDEALKKALSLSSKDRSENVMVVDLVRNDFSRVCKAGTVKVDELFGIYSFPQVHQMISTISGQLMEGVGIKELVETGFPMGSMTGAPKKKVMELIHQYEPIERGIFSGAVGYINPNKDFDFNVVIRSLLYNSQNKYLSYLVGSGITIYSNPELEYEECLLKASAMEKVLGN